MAEFRNTEYRKEWERFARNSEHEYADGTYVAEGDRYAVYDGAQNFMGYVKPNGTFDCDGALTEYKASFLRTAKAELIRQGLVCRLTGDEP